MLNVTSEIIFDHWCNVCVCVCVCVSACVNAEPCFLQHGG
jgi:hypothetical protein